MNESFEKIIDNLNFLSVMPGGSSTVHQNNEAIENLKAKENSLLEKEMELLKRENELLKSTVEHSSTPNYGFTFKDVEESLSKFSGDNNLKIEKWITEFEEMAATIGWNEIQKLVYAKRLLVGTAKQSINSKSGIKTWQDLQEYLKQEFKMSVNSAQIHRMLSERQKRPNESFYSYLLAMQEIAQLGCVEYEALFDYVISGIADAEVNKSVLYGAESMEQFKNKLKIYENIKIKTVKKPEAAINFYNKEESRSRRGPRCYACGDSGHLGRNCPNKGKGVKCYKCNNFGHIATNCTETTKSNILAVKELVNNNMKKVIINGVEQYAMVDSGSDYNLITRKKYNMLGSPQLSPDVKKLRCAGSQYLITDGCFLACVNIDNDTYNSSFHVVADDLLPVSVIIIESEVIQHTITILTPNEIIIKKLLPDNYVLSIHQEDEFPVDISHVSSKSETNELRKLVMNYSSVKEVIEPVPVRLKILLSDDKPVYQRPRRLAPLEMNIARQQIEKWLEQGIIRNSTSEYASPIVLVNKKDGTKRLCVDYRKLNQKIIKDRYPLPLIEEQIDQLQEAHLYTTLDLKEGFFHVPIEEESI